MSGNWDANLKVISAVDKGTTFAVDAIPPGAAFDVIADVEVGEQLMSFDTEHTLIVTLRNISESTTVARVVLTDKLPGQKGPLTKALTVAIPTWVAQDGDVMQAQAAYKVKSGINTDFSTGSSQEFVASA